MKRARAFGGMGVVMIALAAGPDVRAELVLGEYIIDRQQGFLGVVTSLTHETFLSPVNNATSGFGTLFETIVLSDGADRVDEVRFGGDDDFPEYVSLVTDGLDWYVYDALRFNTGGVSTFVGLESQRLPPSDPKEPPPDDFGGCPDLCGATITRVVRELTLSLESPGSDPNGDGNWTEMNIRSVTTIYGIPEPGTLSLAAPVLAALAFRRRR